MNAIEEKGITGFKNIVACCVAFAFAFFFATAAVGATPTFTDLYDFPSSGTGVSGGVVLAPDGALYGVLKSGGANGKGGIYQLGLPSSGANTYSVFYSFSALDAQNHNTDGATPLGTPVVTPDGKGLYLTTMTGGSNGDGTLLQIALPTTAMPSPLPTILANFGATGSNPGFTGVGVAPSTMVLDSHGVLYGITRGGGANYGGQVWKWDGSPHTLYDFGNAPDGFAPFGGVVLGSDGNLWGVAQYGGAHNSGTIYKVTPAGVETTMYSYSANTLNTSGYPVNSDGDYPLGLGEEETNYPTGLGDGFLVDTLYGGANGFGTVGFMSITGTFTVLGSLPGVDTHYFNTGGAQATGAPITDPSGNIYISFGFGGANGNGAISELVVPSPANPSTTLTLNPLFVANSTSGLTPNTNINGSKPTGPMSLANNTLYGTEKEGGASGTGSVFKIDLAGAPPVGVAPVVTISANPTVYGPSTIGTQLAPTTITWTSTGAVGNCTASGSWSGTLLAQGSDSYQPIDNDTNAKPFSDRPYNGGTVSDYNTYFGETYTFTITCTNAFGSTSESTSVYVFSSIDHVDGVPRSPSGGTGNSSGGAVDAPMFALLLMLELIRRRRRS